MKSTKAYVFSKEKKNQKQTQLFGYVLLKYGHVKGAHLLECPMNMIVEIKIDIRILLQ